MFDEQGYGGFGDHSGETVPFNFGSNDDTDDYSRFLGGTFFVSRCSRQRLNCFFGSSTSSDRIFDRRSQEDTCGRLQNADIILLGKGRIHIFNTFICQGYIIRFLIPPHVALVVLGFVRPSRGSMYHT